MTDPEVLRKLTEKNKIADFGMKVLGMDERRAEVFVAACGDRFIWDGTLRFKGASGEVPVDDPQCIGFFQREYDFLVPAKSNGDSAPDVPAELLEKALAGNQTARAQIHRLRGDPDVAATDKFLAGERAKGSTGDTRQRDDKGQFVANDGGNNPFTATNWNLTAQMRLYRSDPKLAERLAKAAGTHVGAARPAARAAS
jgi:hypothetical protein